jgi:hypothetical protein
MRDKASSLDSPLSGSISEAICCLLIGWGSTGVIDPKTFWKYMWSFICSIADLETVVVSLQSFFSMISFELYSPYFLKIVFESRKDSGSLNNCLISVDGTDVRIPQQGPAIPRNPFSSFKFKGKCRLRYKIGVDILPGNIVWVNGPYAAGEYTDINFFSVAWRIGWMSTNGWRRTMDTLGRRPRK